MPTLTKTQRAAIELVIARLNPEHPEFAGSPVIDAWLRDASAKPYLDSWVRPLLDFLRDGEAYNGQADEIRRDHANRKAAARARMRALGLPPLGSMQ